MFMFVVKHPRRPTQMSVSTDADVRIDWRRRPHRPAQTSVSTDADARIDRRGCSSFCLEDTFCMVSICKVLGSPLSKTKSFLVC